MSGMVRRIKSEFEKTFIIKEIRIWVIIGIIFQCVILIAGGICTIGYINKFDNNQMIRKVCDIKIEKWKALGFSTQVGQLNHLSNMNKTKHKNLEKMKKRVEGLEQIYLNKDHPNFHKIDYSEIEKLNDQINKLEKKKILYPINIMSLLGIFVSTAFLYFLQSLGIYLSHRHARKIFLEKELSQDYENNKAIFWISFSLISAVFLCREFYTSFILIEKPIYGWTSFCISEISWICKLLYFVCGSFLPAYTFTWGYFLSSKTFVPDIDFEAHDTKCGVGDYVLFLQTWSIVASILGIFTLLIWVNIIFKLDYDKVYLVDLVVFFILTVIIVSRLVIRAVSLKLKYYAKIKAFGMTYKEIVDSKYPPDPTVGFLGERWWSFPTSIMAIIAAIWFSIKFFNLEEFLLGILK